MCRRLAAMGCRPAFAFDRTGLIWPNCCGLPAARPRIFITPWELMAPSAQRENAGRIYDAAMNGAHLAPLCVS
jgi:hypothetical protein